MVLEKFSSSLKNVLSRIAKSIFVDEKLINEIIKEIQRALLQADVNVQLVFELSEKIKKRALKEKVPSGITQKEYLIKIVYEELTNLLGKEKEEIKIERKKPFKIMMVGLFGSGKCVHPKSLIPLTSGEIITAEDLYAKYDFKHKELEDDAEIINIENENLYVPSFNLKTLKIENKKATHLWKLKEKDLLEVNLDNGNDFSVKVTPEHPFFVLRQGNVKQVRADQLTEEDYIAIPRIYNTNTSYINLFDEIKKLDLTALVGKEKAKKELPSKFSTINEAHKKLSFKRNYCNFITLIKKGELPIEFLNKLDNSKIRIRNSTVLISFPEYLIQDLSEFLGYVIGDGHLDKKSVQIFNEDKEVIERVIYLSKSLFSIEPTLSKDKRAKNLYRISLISTTLVQILNKVFKIPIGKKGKKIRIPSQILKSNDLCIQSFLRAYFDCESYPSMNSRQIEITSESSLLIKDINLALLRLGIVSTISKKIISDIPYWRLSIRARYAEIYSEKIGFLINKKLEKVKRYKQIGLIQGCGKQDLIPVSERLKESREKSGFSIGEIQKICTSYGRYENFGIISRESLYKVKELYKRKLKGMHHILLNDLQNKINLKNKYANYILNSFISYYKQRGIIDSDLNLTKNGQMLLQKSSQENSLIGYLELLSESDACWIKVKSISNFKSKEEIVYDLTVEDNHSFIADGIIVHNTTTIGKLATYYKKRGYKIATLGLDVHRPAAPQQLKQLSQQVQVPFYIDEKEKDPIKIYNKHKDEFSNYDILIIDTAGRDALSQDLLNEIKELNNKIKPDEKILVISGDIGQAAQDQAKAFNEACGVTSVIVSKLDGTARGGGALAACSATNAKIKFIGVGEKLEDLETYNPEGFVSRILGMGDIEALLEKAKESITEEKAQDLSKKLLKGEFNLIDLYEQMNSMKKMGSLSKIMEMIPGMGQLKLPGDILKVQEGKLEHWKQAMSSMTKEELENPDVISTSRLARISKGSGISINEIRELLKQYKQSKKLIKLMKGQDPSKIMKKFQGKMPFKI